MKREDLFLAIGEVEETRLMGTELSVHSASGEPELEVRTMKKKTGRFLRNTLVAALLVSMLAVTAFAATAFIIYDSPEEMLTAVFGDQTGFDHKGVTQIEDPGYDPIENPAYDRVPANETVVKEDILPYVSPVGQTLQHDGYTLTIDANVYDSATQCGLLTYTLENPNGIADYGVQPNGEIYFKGGEVVHFNQGGESIIIQDKTTDTVLTATYHYRYDSRHGENFEIYLYGQRLEYDDEERLMREFRQEYEETLTVEEAEAQARELMGGDVFDSIVNALREEQPEKAEDELLRDLVYDLLASARYGDYYEEYMDSIEKIRFSMPQESAMNHVTLAQGSVVISPIAFVIDVMDLEFLHTDINGHKWIDGSNVDEVIIRFADGTEYTVIAHQVDNTVDSISSMPEGGTQTQKFVPPEEDPAGEGCFITERDPYSILILMFNRVIDVDQITSVLVNGTELTLD